MNEVRDLSRREIWIRKLLYPAYRWPGVALAASPIVVAVGLAIRDGVFVPFPAFLAFLCGWLIQLGGVLAGNYRNLQEDPEDAEHPELVQAVRSGTLRLETLRIAVWACFLIVGLACAYLFFVAGVGVALFGLAGIIASWAYSSGPVPLGKAGAADPLFFCFFGIVAVLGTYYVQAAPVYSPTPMWEVVRKALPWTVVAVSLPVGALATNILIIDDIRDREFDAIKGKRTIAVRFGLFWSRTEFVALICLSYVSLFAFWILLGFSAVILLPLATLPLAFIVVRTVATKDRYRDLLPVKRRMAWLLLSFSLLLAIGIVASTNP